MSSSLYRTGLLGFAFFVSFASVPLMPAAAFALSGKASDNASVAHETAKNKHEEKKQRTSKPVTTDSSDNQKTDNPQTSEVETAPSTPVKPHTATRTSTIKPSDPAGNNGTVKIDSQPFDSHPDNQPHVTCSFQVDFYGYDRGVGDANIDFKLQSPTKDGTLSVTSGDLTPNIGEDAAAGGTDLDASQTYGLAFTGTPHAKQGYHVKLTVHAPGSQGADTKHKVFWVTPCDSTPAQTPGVISGEGASTTRPQVLGSSVTPDRLPSTGEASRLALITGLFASLTVYGATYFLQDKKRFIQ